METVEPQAQISHEEVLSYECLATHEDDCALYSEYTGSSCALWQITGLRCVRQSQGPLTSFIRVHRQRRCEKASLATSKCFSCPQTAGFSTISSLDQCAAEVNQ
eukprot:3556329-Amphidinium_carterae.1